MLFRKLAAVLVLSSGFSGTSHAADEPQPDYAVVVSQKTLADPSWRRVVETLQAKHRGQVIAYVSLRQARDELAKLFPRYACFVATPAEASREFVAEVHRLTRQLDDDPYTDVIWGILTGYDADNALRIARHQEPLTIRRVAAGTEVALDLCEEGVWYCELQQHRMFQKKRGEPARQERGPDDTTKALVDALNAYHADLFVTSGHATERDWQIGFRYRNGAFVSKAGRLEGVDTAGQRYAVNSPNPKVYLPIGNCLMGHIDGPEAMALAFMNSAGVYQMLGYTVPTWFGYGGWGCLDYFVEQPGRYTFAEAFFANHQALLQRIESDFREAGKEAAAPTAADAMSDERGLRYDRDVVAFYGDPAWEARLAPGPLAWDQQLREQQGQYTFELVPQLGRETFTPRNTNGSQRGGRPIFAFLPHRVRQVQVVEGQELRPLITDNFLLIPNPHVCDPQRVYRVVFRAERIE